MWIISVGISFLVSINDQIPQQPEILYIYIGVDGGGYESAKIIIYSNMTYEFHHSGDCYCGIYIDDQGNWKENRKGVLLLKSDRKIKDLDCKKRKIFRDFRIDPKEDIIQVPDQIYGYRKMVRFIPSKEKKYN